VPSKSPQISPDALLVTIEHTRTLLGGVSRSLVEKLIAQEKLESVALGDRRMVTMRSIRRLAREAA
jgi:hypothetical protein